MDVQIDVVTGFLESGKTTFIKALLERGPIGRGLPTILVICEEGLEEYDPAQLAERNVVPVTMETPETLSREFFQQLVETHRPRRILIEYNGTWKMADLLKIRLPDGCRINSIVGLADASTFESYLANMSRFMAEQLANCDVVFINRYEALDAGQIELLKRSIKNINRKAQQIFI